MRKAGVGVKLVDDAGMLFENYDDLFIHCGTEDPMGYKERQKARDLTRQISNLYRYEARSELLRETIREAITNLPEVKFPLVLPHKKADKVLVVGIGDTHYGAEINVTGLYGETVNRYDHVVFESRMARLMEEILDIVEKEEITEVAVFFVGDLLDGMLRQSQLMRLEYGVVESTMRLSEYLANWLNEISQTVRVSVCAVSGNHSEIRPLKSKKGEFEDENLEKIVFWYMQERLAGNDNVFVQAEVKKMMLVELLNFKILLLHGDGEKDIEQIAKNTVNMYGHPIDFFMCGHKHRESEIPSGMTANGDSVIVRVPSICGVDKYAQSKGYSGKPGAIAIVLERNYGRRCVYPIQL